MSTPRKPPINYARGTRAADTTSDAHDARRNNPAFAAAVGAASPASDAAPVSKPKRAKPDAVQEASAYAELDDRNLMTLVARHVPYRDFVLDGDADGELLDVGVYRRLLSLALYDSFKNSAADEVKAAGCGVTLEELPALRAHRLYPRLRQTILDKLTVFTRTLTFDGMAEQVEDLMARDEMRLATVSGNLSVRHDAMHTFISRRSAAKAREVNITVMAVPERLRDEIREGMQYLQEQEPKLIGAGSASGEGGADDDGDDDGIDASVLNVPRIAPSPES